MAPKKKRRRIFTVTWGVGGGFETQRKKENRNFKNGGTLYRSVTKEHNCLELGNRMGGGDPKKGRIEKVSLREGWGKAGGRSGRGGRVPQNTVHGVC